MAGAAKAKAQKHQRMYCNYATQIKVLFNASLLRVEHSEVLNPLTDTISLWILRHISLDILACLRCGDTSAFNHSEKCKYQLVMIFSQGFRFSHDVQKCPQLLHRFVRTEGIYHDCAIYAPKTPPVCYVPTRNDHKYYILNVIAF